MTSQLVLFVCTHNKGRSQIGSALFNQFADPRKARAISAGLEPAAHVQGEVIAVMREVGIDLADVEPIALTGQMLTELNFLVTLGAPNATRPFRCHGGGIGVCATHPISRSTKSASFAMKSADSSPTWPTTWAGRRRPAPVRNWFRRSPADDCLRPFGREPVFPDAITDGDGRFTIAAPSMRRS